MSVGVISEVKTSRERKEDVTIRSLKKKKLNKLCKLLMETTILIHLQMTLKLT